MSNDPQLILEAFQRHLERPACQSDMGDAFTFACGFRAGRAAPQSLEKVLTHALSALEAGPCQAPLDAEALLDTPGERSPQTEELANLRREASAVLRRLITLASTENKDTP